MKNCTFCKTPDHDPDDDYDYSSDFVSIRDPKGRNLYLCDGCQSDYYQDDVPEETPMDTDSIEDHLPAEYFTEREY